MFLLNRQFIRQANRIGAVLGLSLALPAGMATAQFPVTPEQAAEIVQAQVVAGAEADLQAAEAAAESVVQFDPLAPEVYGEGTITQIVVQGNQRLSTNTILTLLNIQIGEDFQPLRLDAALKALYRTGQFADVRLDRQGSVLIIQVRENLLINQVAFEGNSALSDSELSGLASVKERTLLKRTEVASDIQEMKESYEREGRLMVIIEPKIIPLSGNRANLVYEITEGSRTRVDAVNFVGNTAYTDRRLRTAILTRQTNLLRNLLQADGYAPDRIAVDRRFLTEYYQSRGYADFEVISAVAEQTPEKRGLILTFTVKEGIKYRFGRVRIANNLPGVDTSRLVNQLKVRTGRTYDVLDVEETREDMIERVSSQGFPFVDVVVTEDSDPSRGVVDLTFTI
ncbi:MAG: POTRA domain-containing protein [Alphaproteobacteria bacterium]